MTRRSKEEKSSKGGKGTILSMMRGRKTSSEVEEVDHGADKLADRRRPKRETSPAPERTKSSKGMNRSRSHSLNPNRSTLSARGSMRHVPPQLAPIPGSAPPPAQMSMAPGLSMGMSQEQVQHLLQLPPLPVLFQPDGQPLLMPSFPFPIPQELMPQMMKHFQATPMTNGAPIRSSNASPMTSNPSSKNLNASSMYNNSASATNYAPSSNTSRPVQSPPMQRGTSILQHASSFKRPMGDSNGAQPVQTGSILQKKSSFKRPANPQPPQHAQSEELPVLPSVLKASGGLERVASKRPPTSGAADGYAQSSSSILQSSKFKPQLSEEEEAELKRQEEERIQQQRATEYARAKTEQIVRENIIEGRIAAERQRQATDIQKGVAERHFFNSVEEQARRTGTHAKEPEDFTEEPPEGDEVIVVPAPAAVAAPLEPTPQAAAAAAQPMRNASPKAEKVEPSAAAVPEGTARPVAYHPATLVLYEKKLMVGRKRNAKEDEMNYPVKLYGEACTDVRITKEDGSIEKFRVDELVMHRKGSTFVDSKLVSNVQSMFLSGLRTAVVSIDNSTLTSVPPFETPSWFAIQGLLDAITGKVNTMRDEGAHVELHLSFAAVKLRSPKVQEVKYPRGKAYELVDLLAEGSQEPIPYDQVSDIVYGDRLAGVTYRLVVTREAFLKTFLFAQTAANLVNDNLNNRLACDRDNADLQREKASLMFVVTGVLTQTKEGAPFATTAPEKSDKVDLSASDLISGVPTEAFQPHVSTSTESDRIINVLTCVGIESKLDLCEAALPNSADDAGVPLLRDVLQSPSYLSVITSVDPADVASAAPLQLATRLSALSLPPAQTGSLRRLVGRARANVAAAHEGIRNSRPGSEAQHTHKLLLKKETASLKTFADKTEEPLERRLSIMDNDM